jgi:hypothetical protein
LEKTHKGYLLIADITGYTIYLTHSELDHAQEILANLLELLVDRTRPPLVISRLAGDAVISYGLGDHFSFGQTFIEMIEDTYVAFRKAINQLILNNTCRCNACANVSSLDLKFFVHYGTFAIQELGKHNELVGSDVNLIHRLLKNSVTERTGFTAYTLYTDAAIQQLGTTELNETMTPLVEADEHLGEVQLWIQDMHPIWEEKRNTTQINISPEQINLRTELDIAIPPEIVWDFIANPEHRNILMGTERQEAVKLSHGRIAEGSVYQCYHGDKLLPLTILEWQPFERAIFHSETPIPWATILVVLCLSPTPHGTNLEQIITKSKGPLPARLICDLMVKFMQKEAIADLVKFKDYIETIHAARANPEQ